MDGAGKERPRQDVSSGVREVEAASAADLSRRQVRGSTLITGGRMLSLLFTVTTQVIVVRYLAVEEYGAFAHALVLVGAGRLLLSLGQNGVLSRFLSMYEEQGERARMMGSLLLGVTTVAATSGVGMVFVLLFADDLAASALGREDLTTLLLVLVLLAPLEALDELFIAVFAAMANARSIFIRKYVLMPGLRLLVVVLMVATAQDVVFLAAGYVSAQVFGLVLYAAFLGRILRRRGLLGYLRPSRVSVPVRAVFALAIPSMTGTLVYLSMNLGSVVLLSAFWGAAEIALYRAVFPAAGLNQLIYNAFSTLYLPMAARLFARGDSAGGRDAYWHTAVLLAVFSFPILAMTTVFAPETTITLFGDRYADSAPVLALLSVGYYCSVAFGFNASTLMVLGRGRWMLSVNAVAATANLVLCALLAKAYGAVGVAMANCATVLLQNLLMQLGLVRALPTAFLDRSCIRPYAILLVALGVLWGVDRVFEPGVVVAAVLTVVAALVVLRLCRRELRLSHMFPELGRVPVVRALVE